MTWDDAAKMGLDRLYHYTAFDPDRLSKIILDKALYFSNPGAFNDPWDCRPWLNTEALAESAVLDRHINWYISITRKLSPGITEEEIQRTAETFRSTPEVFIERLEQVSHSMEETINERYRLFCLSSNPESELMWAHYSSKHQGICLEFDAGNELFGGALKVSYQEDYPLFDLTAEGEDENLMPLTTKSAAWSYEDEYRLISQEKDAAVPVDTLMSENNFIELPDGALTAIILGCLVPNSAIPDIGEIIKRSGQPIQLKQASRARAQYKLSIAPI